MASNTDQTPNVTKLLFLLLLTLVLKLMSCVFVSVSHNKTHPGCNAQQQSRVSSFKAKIQKYHLKIHPTFERQHFEPSVLH